MIGSYDPRYMILFFFLFLFARECEMELAKVHAEMKRVATRFVIVLVGLPLLEVVLKTF